MKKFLFPLCTGLLAAGCIHTKEVHHYDDVARTPVEFENDRSARLFYETLSEGHFSNAHREKKTEVSIPIVFSHSSERVSGSNVAFNEAVAQCDTNQDGIITEAEARIFSENFK